MEIYNVQDHLDDATMFNHLMLDGELDELVNRKDFNPKELHVDLKINGVNVSIKNFNHVLKDWADRIEQQVKEDLNYLQKEDAVVEKAKELINQRLNNLRDHLSDIEDNLWKLED